MSTQQTPLYGVAVINRATGKLLVWMHERWEAHVPYSPWVAADAGDQADLDKQLRKAYVNHEGRPWVITDNRTDALYVVTGGLDEYPAGSIPLTVAPVSPAQRAVNRATWEQVEAKGLRS